MRATVLWGFEDIESSSDAMILMTVFSIYLNFECYFTSFYVFFRAALSVLLSANRRNILSAKRMGLTVIGIQGESCTTSTPNFTILLPYNNLTSINAKATRS